MTEFFGVPKALPNMKLSVSNPEGTKMAVAIDGCPDGTYNQRITIFDTDVRAYMPNVSQTKGGFSNPDKIAFKMMGERGQAFGRQLRDMLAKSLAEATDLKKFLAPAERTAVCLHSPERASQELTAAPGQEAFARRADRVLRRQDQFGCARANSLLCARLLGRCRPLHDPGGNQGEAQRGDWRC